MLEIKDVPFRKWHNGQLVETAEGKKVRALMYKEMARGKAVELTQSQPLTRIPVPGEIAPPKSLNGTTYDTISLTVTD